MFRNAMLAAAICSCFGSSSFGGFTVTIAQTFVDATFDRVDFYALNTGGDTGSGLLAVEFTSTATAGEAIFRSTAAGNWNPLNSTDTSNRSQVRVDPEDVSSSALVSKTPSANQPLSPQYGPSTVALGNFSVVIAGLSGAIPPQSPVTGNLFASLYVSKTYHARFSGNVGGSAGPKVGFSIQVAGPTDPHGLVTITPGATSNVVFGQVVTSGAAFSVNVQVTSTNQADLLSLAVSSVAGVSNVSVQPSAANSPAIFNVTGTVDYSLNQSVVVVPLTASNGFITSSGSFSLVVTPEPGMLSVLAASGFVRRRR